MERRQPTLAGADHDAKRRRLNKLGEAERGPLCAVTRLATKLPCLRRSEKKPMATRCQWVDLKVSRRACLFPTQSCGGFEEISLSDPVDAPPFVVIAGAHFAKRSCGNRAPRRSCVASTRRPDDAGFFVRGGRRHHANAAHRSSTAKPSTALVTGPPALDFFLHDCVGFAQPRKSRLRPVVRGSARRPGPGNGCRYARRAAMPALHRRAHLVLKPLAQRSISLRFIRSASRPRCGGS